MESENKRKKIDFGGRPGARGFDFALSRFKVGAALLTKAGQVIGGANVESASYGLTCCAERIALFKALTAGRKEFAAIAVVARCADGRCHAAPAANYSANMHRMPGCWSRTAGIEDDATIHCPRTFTIGFCDRSLNFTKTIVVCALRSTYKDELRSCT